VPNNAVKLPRRRERRSVVLQRSVVPRAAS
jgi:hypothetical protein